jgi:hypothetical protein
VIFDSIRSLLLEILDELDGKEDEYLMLFAGYAVYQITRLLGC